MSAVVYQTDKPSLRRLISSKLCETMSGNESDALSKCLALTVDVWVGLCDGEVVCVWGLIPPSLLADQAYLWLYTSPALKGREFIFVRRSQIAVREMLERYPTITGHCSVGSQQSIAWLRWLGAIFAEPLGTALPFVIRKS